MAKKITIRFFLFLDARFNKALIDNCQNDIGKYCQGEVMNDDDDDDDDDGENDKNEENNNNNGKFYCCYS